jgi:hypothetical protein
MVPIDFIEGESNKKTTAGVVSMEIVRFALFDSILGPILFLGWIENLHPWFGLIVVSSVAITPKHFMSCSLDLDRHIYPQYSILFFFNQGIPINLFRSESYILSTSMPSCPSVLGNSTIGSVASP